MRRKCEDKLKDVVYLELGSVSCLSSWGWLPPESHRSQSISKQPFLICNCEV
ncbi:hypothetical protein Lalb_Chr14g0367141 [Lupinus albus]|uniref:Uncharacterized protein n=1 Tax=Lupinus albus TaxID=3870 RepID=A0A6A4PEK8_LUPAL|nr:hypothetical protein Lalb_Chr14g0367141 [Lupinus albus]